MKKLSLAFCMLFCLLAAKAQSANYHAFKLDLSLGLDFLSQKSASLIATMEPHYRLTDEFALGLRYQGAVDFASKPSGLNVYAYASGCISGDYYVTDVKQKAVMFVGGGAGVFTELKGNSNEQVDNFGFFPRIGLETGRFRASLEYNVTGGVNNYFSVNVGLYIWGGRK